MKITIEKPVLLGFRKHILLELVNVQPDLSWLEIPHEL
jgi:hypothetical protein